MTRLTSITTTVILTLALSAIPLLFSGVTAYAKDRERSDNSAKGSSDAVATDTEITPTRQKKSPTRTKDKLADKRLKACKKKEDSVQLSMQRVSSQGERQLAMFHGIADRTQKFYVDKGYSDPRYAALVADLDSLYQTSLTTTQSLSTLSKDWNCDGDNPKQQLQLFRDAKKAEVEVLKTYKEKVRSLISLVKQAATKEDK